MDVILGKFGAIPTIAKSFEVTMTKYFTRFIKKDENVNKDAIGWALNAKHRVVAEIYKLDPKY